MPCEQAASLPCRRWRQPSNAVFITPPNDHGPIRRAERLRNRERRLGHFLYDVYSDLLNNMCYGGDWLPQLTRALEACALMAATVRRDARGRQGRTVPRRWWSRPATVVCVLWGLAGLVYALESEDTSRGRVMRFFGTCLLAGVAAW